jgi:tellurite resistance protein TerC
MTIWVWVFFLVGILVLLALDLFVVHRTERVLSLPEALAWSAFWVVLSLGFNLAVIYAYDLHWFGIGHDIAHPLTGQQAGLQFLTAYLVEKSLSLDNIFVIALIFTYFRVPLGLQHRVLFWGVLGAIVLRGAMIAGGVALINRFDWMVYVFGALLLVTAIKLLIARHDNLAPDRNPLVKLARRIMPVHDRFVGEHFLARIDGRWLLTPLGLVILVVESSDVLFAVDSIPAVLAVTRDPFLVFTSNVFAILGLRALYFALAGLMNRFGYLKFSMVFILAYVGMKMILSHHYVIPTWVSLVVMSGFLVIGVLASIVGASRDTAPLVSPAPSNVARLTELTLQQGKRVTVILLGSAVILAGMVMLLLPGPGLLTILIGLAILGTELVWARRLLNSLKRRAADLGNSFNLKNKFRINGAEIDVTDREAANNDRDESTRP